MKQRRKRNEHPVLAEPLTAWSLLSGTVRVLVEAAGPLSGAALAVLLPLGVVLALVTMDQRAAMLLEILVGVVAGGALILVAHGAITGARLSVGDAILAALRRWGALIIVELVVQVIVLVYLVPLILAGWAAVRWLEAPVPLVEFLVFFGSAVLAVVFYLLAGPIVMLEATDRRATAGALGRSSRLLYGHRFRVLLGGLPFLVVSFVVGMQQLLAPEMADGPMAKLGWFLLRVLVEIPMSVFSVVAYVKAARSHEELMREVREG